MRHNDIQTCTVCKLLKLVLPHSDSVVVASIAIASYVQLLCSWDRMLPNRLPPARNAFNSKLARIVTRAYIDETNVVVDGENAIWRDFPKLL